MQRRDLFRLSAAALVAGSVPSTARAGLDDARPVPDGRLTAPLPLPEGEIRVAFVLGPGAEVIDFAGPWGVFEYVTMPDGRPPFRLYTVAAERRPLKLSGGLTVVPDYRLRDAPSPHVVIVPAMQADQVPGTVHAWLRATLPKADLTASICDGAYVLGDAGLLDGKAVTAHHGGYGMLAALYPKADVRRGLRYVEDGRLASSGGLTSGIDLALRVVERYFGRAVAEQTAGQLEYLGDGWKYPASNAVFAKRRPEQPGHPRCPVCEADVEIDPSLQADYEGTTYHFCSDVCRRHFLAGPARILGPR